MTRRIVEAGGRESLKTTARGLLVSARKISRGVVLRFECSSEDLFSLARALQAREQSTNSSKEPSGE